jgi:alpha-tubulin suppressor-like RCC1 family protein
MKQIASIVCVVNRVKKIYEIGNKTKKALKRVRMRRLRLRRLRREIEREREREDTGR